MDNHYIWVEYKVSLIFTYISILFLYLFTFYSFCIFFQVYLLSLSHLYGNDISSLAGKSSVHWDISPVKPLLNGRENSIVAEASLLTGVFLVTGLDVSAHVWALLDGFFCRFPLPGYEGLML